jgi:hypothetical protein
MASTVTRFQSSGFVPVGKPKILVYAAPVDNEEALHHRMWMPVRLSATAPAFLSGCGGPDEFCIEFHGSNFEHLS